MTALDPTPAVRTRALTTSAREVRFARFRVRVVAGPDAGREVTAPGSELTVGSAEGSTLVLSDPAVSRRHCEIVATAAGFALRDLGSTNGTTLGGHRVESAYVAHGAVIGVGGSALAFEVLDEHEREALSEARAFGDVLGASAAMRRVFAMLEKCAPTDVTVLLEGETGTGKGLVAEAIHHASPRAGGPFVTVDCGAIPASLIESELFGHERGAFTDAQDTRVGAFEQAHGGTVFLDEIGELPLDMQPKLLRVLESRVVRRVGSLQPIPLDLRVIAATNRDLSAAVNRGRFRADLYYRLAIMRLRIPPLRERRDDVPLLAAQFYARFARGTDPAPPPELLAGLLERDWPGNVRELRNAVERAVLFGELERPAPGGEPGDLSMSFRDAKARAMERWEARYLRELMRRFGGNLSRAARAVAMDRNHLRALLRQYGVARRQP